MKLIGTHIIILLGCAYLGLAQNALYDYLPPDGSDNNNNRVTFPTTPRTTRPRPTPPRTTPFRPTPSRTTPSRPTPSRTTPSRPTPSRTTPSRPTPFRTTPSRPTPPRTTPPRPTPPTTEPHDHHHHDDHHHHHSDDPLDWLREAVPGEPGDDYPIYWKVPETQFTCSGRGIGLYADPETRCQAFHICSADSTGNFNYISMLCPNGTIFNQKHFTCEWWQNVECTQTEQYYALNDLIGVVPDGAGSGNFNQRVRPDPISRQPEPSYQPEPSRPRQPEPSRPRQPEPSRTRQPEPSRPRQPEPSRTRQPQPSRTRQPAPPRPRHPAPVQNTVEEGYAYGAPGGQRGSQYGRRI